MKKRKNYGRKIKRSKINLYPKRKTKAQKILGTVLLVIVLLGIVFLGYCLANPLLRYIEEYFGASDSNEPVWTPPQESTSAVSETTESPAVTDTAESTTEIVTTAPPQTAGKGYTITVPSSALANSASLSAFAAKSAAEGYTAAMIHLKDSAGNLRYLSGLEEVQDTEVINGTLTAEEISNTLSEKGLAPIAVLSVLADNAGCAANPDMSYKVTDEENVSWLDYTYENPVRWADPASKATIAYNKAVYDELKNAGFEQIVLADIVFPDFQDYDRRYIESRYFDSGRYKLLADVVPEGASVQVNAEDIVITPFTKTAEVLKNKAALSESTVLVRISRAPFPTESGYPADAGNLLESVMGQAATRTGLTLVPMIEKADFTPAEIEDMKETAEKMGYTEFYVR